jgi:hypothetical protein
MELLTFELKGSGEWESDQPGRGGATGTADVSGSGALASVLGGKEACRASAQAWAHAGSVLCLRDDAYNVWADLVSLWWPEVSHSGRYNIACYNMACLLGRVGSIFVWCCMCPRLTLQPSLCRP